MLWWLALQAFSGKPQGTADSDAPQIPPQSREGETSSHAKPCLECDKTASLCARIARRKGQNQYRWTLLSRILKVKSRQNLFFNSSGGRGLCCGSTEARASVPCQRTDAWVLGHKHSAPVLVEPGSPSPELRWFPSFPSGSHASTYPSVFPANAF